MRQKNNSFSEIGTELLAAERIFLLTHVNMDGDTLGSAAALCHGLRRAGKECHVLIGDPIPDDLKFLDQGLCTMDSEKISPDLCVAIDCSDLERLGARKELFSSAKRRICVDHHATNEQSFADLNYIDESAAATGELVYGILSEMERISGSSLMDKECAEAVYAAIVTDTGNFQYSSTTKKTHEIAAALFDKGIDHAKVSIELYQSMRAEKLQIQARILDRLEIFGEGKAVIACVDQKMLEETGAVMDETEGTAEQLRNIRGVEISAFLKEKDRGEVKVSLRAKSFGDVAVIAKKFGGGGHTKAAGCTLHHSLPEAVALIRAEVEQQLEKCIKDGQPS